MIKSRCKSAPDLCQSSSPTFRTAVAADSHAIKRYGTLPLSLIKSPDSDNNPFKSTPSQTPISKQQQQQQQQSKSMHKDHSHREMSSAAANVKTTPASTTTAAAVSTSATTANLHLDLLKFRPATTPTPTSWNTRTFTHATGNSSNSNTVSPKATPFEPAHQSLLFASSQSHSNNNNNNNNFYSGSNNNNQNHYSNNYFVNSGPMDYANEMLMPRPRTFNDLFGYDESLTMTRASTPSSINFNGVNSNICKTMFGNAHIQQQLPPSATAAAAAYKQQRKFSQQSGCELVSKLSPNDESNDPLNSMLMTPSGGGGGGDGRQSSIGTAASQHIDNHYFIKEIERLRNCIYYLEGENLTLNLKLNKEKMRTTTSNKRTISMDREIATAIQETSDSEEFKL